MASLYDLDRWDLSVTTTVDGAVQARVTELLRSLADPGRAEALGLREPDLLGRQDPAGVTYSMTLLEHVNGANLVRVQADNADRPLDINRGVKLDLGSSAKLRTLVTYLDVIARLHERYRTMNATELAEERAARSDSLGIWVLDRVSARRQESLTELLQAAMARRYSASPGGAFFTGGGRHVFSNFDRKDDGRVLSVAEAFERSVNLVFIRMMADIVAAHQAGRLAAGERLAAIEPGAVRDAYLAKFADQEGSEYLRRFYREYVGLPPAQVIERLLEKTRPTPAAFATVLAGVQPGMTPQPLAHHLQTHLKESAASPAALADLLERHGPDRLSLADRGYVARVHPLELWMAARLVQGDSPPLSDLLAESHDERQHVYQWLFKTRNKRAQDRRITMLLEQEAFIDIHTFWQRLGYPFASLVPSLATAIGSSADHPAALTELLGIIANGGMRHPTVYLTELTFATETPYETQMRPVVGHSERVLPVEVAEVTRAALAGVVARGTARRLNRFTPELASSIGGKTGTGDHRYERHGSAGQVIESRVVNRSAVFTFVIGDRFFGTVTAFVPGEAAGRYRFTSALPVQILGHLLPVLEPVLSSPLPAGMPVMDPGQLAGSALPPVAKSG